MVKRFDWLLVYLLFSIGVMAQSGGKQYNSYRIGHGRLSGVVQHPW